MGVNRKLLSLIEKQLSIIAVSARPRVVPGEESFYFKKIDSASIGARVAQTMEVFSDDPSVTPEYGTYPLCIS